MEVGGLAWKPDFVQIFYRFCSSEEAPGFLGAWLLRKKWEFSKRCRFFADTLEQEARVRVTDEAKQGKKAGDFLLVFRSSDAESLPQVL